MEVNDLEIPNFPAIQKCILIDSRHRSRKEIAVRIQSSMLYGEIVEALSVADGLSKLGEGIFGSCFMGPTLSQAVVFEFLAKGAQVSKSKDCAFLVVFNENAETKISEALIAEYRSAGAHGVIIHPCSQEAFVRETVTGVLAANPNSAWAPLAVLNGFTSSVAGTNDVWNIKSVEAAFSVIASSLKILASEIRSGDVGLNAEGKPTDLALSKLSKIIQHAFAGNHSIIKGNVLLPSLERLLTEWLIECCTNSESVALAKLKKSLFGLGF